MEVLAVRLEPALLTALEDNLRATKVAMAQKDRERFHALDLEFHELLLGRLGYDRVKVAVDAARASLDRMRLIMADPRRQASTFAEHRALVDALKKRNPRAAASAMGAHLDTVMAELECLALEHPDAFAEGGERKGSGRVAA